jgi:hypothetical protein
LVRNRSASRAAARVRRPSDVVPISDTYRLTDGIQGGVGFGIVAGREAIEHGHDLRAPEGLPPLDRRRAESAGRAIAGRVLDSADGVEAAVDLPAHVVDLAERASSPVARVRGPGARSGPGAGRRRCGRGRGRFV